MSSPTIICGPEFLDSDNSLCRYYVHSNSGKKFAPTIPGIVLDIMHLSATQKVLALGRPGVETPLLRQEYNKILEWLSVRYVAERTDGQRRVVGQGLWCDGGSFCVQPAIYVTVSPTTVKDSMSSPFTENGCLPYAESDPPVMAMGALVRCSAHALREDVRSEFESVHPTYNRHFRLVATLLLRLYQREALACGRPPEIGTSPRSPGVYFPHGALASATYTPSSPDADGRWEYSHLLGVYVDPSLQKTSPSLPSPSSSST